ncbi:hypothetical protein NYA9BBAC_02048 [Salinibacterium sp. NYA9b]
MRPSHAARPTIRLLNELNRSGAFGSGDADALEKSQFKRLGSITALNHPIIRRAARIGTEEFEDSGTLAWGNRIKYVTQAGLRSPWFEIRAEQWRGAVVDPKNDGNYWLVAAGLRREGDTDNFYDVLERKSKENLLSILPSTRDETLRKIQALDAESSANKRAAVGALFDALRSFDLDLTLFEWSSTVALPACFSSMGVTIGIDRIATDALITIEIEMEDFGESQARGELLHLLQAPFECDMEKWEANSSPNPRRLIYSATVPLARLRQLVSSSRIEGQPETTAAPSSHLVISRSHFARKASLADATVFGLAVRAICGQWFVPSQDPSDLPSCRTCRTTYETISQ